MNPNQGKAQVALRTMKFLADKNLVSPEFFGIVSSVNEVNERLTAFFGMYVLDGKRDVCANITRLYPIVKVISKGANLSEEEILDVCVEVTQSVRDEYLEFVKAWGEDFDLLMTGKQTLH